MSGPGVRRPCDHADCDELSWCRLTKKCFHDACRKASHGCCLPKPQIGPFCGHQHCLVGFHCLTGKRSRSWNEEAKEAKYVAMRKQVVWMEIEVPVRRARDFPGFLSAFRKVAPPKGWDVPSTGGKVVGRAVRDESRDISVTPPSSPLRRVLSRSKVPSRLSDDGLDDSELQDKFRGALPPPSLPVSGARILPSLAGADPPRRVGPGSLGGARTPRAGLSGGVSQDPFLSPILTPRQCIDLVGTDADGLAALGMLPGRQQRYGEDGVQGPGSGVAALGPDQCTVGASSLVSSPGFEQEHDSYQDFFSARKPADGRPGNVPKVSEGLPSKESETVRGESSLAGRARDMAGKAIVLDDECSDGSVERLPSSSPLEGSRGHSRRKSKGKGKREVEGPSSPSPLVVSFRALLVDVARECNGLVRRKMSQHLGESQGSEVAGAMDDDERSRHLEGKFYRYLALLDTERESRGVLEGRLPKRELDWEDVEERTLKFVKHR